MKRIILYTFLIFLTLSLPVWAIPPSPPSAASEGMAADGSVPFTGVVETVGVEVKNGADSSGFVDFYEDSSNGTSYFRLYGPEALAGNIFMQLPPTSGTTGGSLYFSGANKLAVAAAGTEGYLWMMGATIPGWAAVPTWNQNTTGTAANLSGTPALPDGTTATTQSQSDGSTKIATTAYVDTGLATKQPLDSALTSLTSKVFAKTALTGAGGLDTVAYADIADGDIGYVGTIAGVWYVYVFEASSSTAESSPNIIAPDDVGGNNGRWLLKLYCDGTSCTVPQSTTGAVSTLLEGSGNGTNFRKTSVPDALTADLNLQHANAVPTADQFQMFPAPTDGVSQYSWTTYGYAKTPVIDDADNFDDNFTGTNLYGGTFIANAAGTAALPDPAVGMNFTIVLEGANAVILEPLATGTDDTIVMNGLAAAQGEYITSSTRGAMCVFQYRAANSWMATCNGFAENTPP